MVNKATENRRRQIVQEHVPKVLGVLQETKDKLFGQLQVFANTPGSSQEDVEWLAVVHRAACIAEYRATTGLHIDAETERLTVQIEAFKLEVERSLTESGLVVPS